MDERHLLSQNHKQIFNCNISMLSQIPNARKHFFSHALLPVWIYSASDGKVSSNLVNMDGKIQLRFHAVNKGATVDGMKQVGENATDTSTCRIFFQQKYLLLDGHAILQDFFYCGGKFRVLSGAHFILQFLQISLRAR